MLKQQGLLGFTLY